MDRREYAILTVIALATVAIGVFTTSKPLSVFFVESTRQFVTTTISMAWITWWALVVGFAIAGGVEAWTSNEAVSDLLEGQGPREIGYGSLFGFVSSSCSYSAIATAKNLFKKSGSAAATLSGMIFVAAVIVGVVIHLLFTGLGLVPAPASARVAEVSIELNYKLVLNVLATGLFVGLYWLHRSDVAEQGGHGGHALPAD